MTTGSFSFLLAGSFLLASTSFTAANLIAGEEDGLSFEEECKPFFFATTDEAGMTFFPEVIPHLFLNPGGHTRMSSTSTFTATGIQGAAVKEGENRLVPGSLRQWRLSGLVIYKGGGSGEEARGVECGGGD